MPSQTERTNELPSAKCLELAKKVQFQMHSETQQGKWASESERLAACQKGGFNCPLQHNRATELWRAECWSLPEEMVTSWPPPWDAVDTNMPKGLPYSDPFCHRDPVESQNCLN